MYITPMALPQPQLPSNANTNKTSNKSKTEPMKRRPSLRQKLRLSSLSSNSPRGSLDSTDTLTSMSENDSQRLSQEHESNHDEVAPPQTNDAMPQTPSHARSISDPNPAPALQRWDGIHRATSQWNCLHKDPDLWYEHGNCAIFLYQPGQSQRGPSFRLPYTLLLDARCTPLLETSLVSTNTGSPWESNRQSNSGEFFLYLYAPQQLVGGEAFAYHVTTRNFVAWIVGRPLVGVNPITAILELKSRMDIWRDPGLDNFRTLLKFTKSQGYADAQSSSAYFRPVSLESINSSGASHEAQQSAQQSRDSAETVSETEKNDVANFTDSVTVSGEESPALNLLTAPRRHSLTTLPEEPLLELQQIDPAPVTKSVETKSSSTRHMDTRYIPQRPAPLPPKIKLSTPPAIPIHSKTRPRVVPPTNSASPLTPSPRSVPELDGGRSSPNSDTDTSESLRSSVQTPTPNEIKAFDFGFGMEKAGKEMIDEVIDVWEKSANAGPKGIVEKREKKKGLLGWGKGVVGKVGDRWEGGKDTVQWMQRGVDGSDDLKDIVQGLAGKG